MDNNYSVGKIYVYSDGKLNYLSLRSCFEAKENYFFENVATLDERYLLNNLICPDDYIVTQTYYNALNSYSSFMYDNDIENVIHPLEEISVKLYGNNIYNTLFGTTLTNNDGYYEFEIEYSDYVNYGMLSYYLLIESYTLGLAIMNNKNNYYEVASRLYSDFNCNDTIYSCIYFYPDKSDRSASFEISQFCYFQEGT